jgi:protein transport protein SEC13
LCSKDRTVKIYDVSGNSYAPNATLTGHSGPIYQLSWSHPKYGTLLASASFDGSVLIHRESRQGEWILVKAFVGLHESSVNSVQFAPHEYGLVCAAGSSDGRVSVLTHGGESNGDDEWTVEYLNDTPLGVNAVSWAPYGVGKEKGEGEPCEPLPPRLVTGGSDNGIRMWTKNAGTGIWEQSVVESSDAHHKDWVRDVAWAPSIIPGLSVIASCSEDKTVIIWKQGGDDNGDDDTKWSSKVLNTFEDPVWRVSWSITGNILAVSSGDANVTLWKEELDGVWSLVNQVEDAAGGAQGE